eukprot:scaffold6341_cov27-Prasinocladus_malaysianus.AAC.1
MARKAMQLPQSEGNPCRAFANETIVPLTVCTAVFEYDLDRLYLNELKTEYKQLVNSLGESQGQEFKTR